MTELPPKGPWILEGHKDLVHTTHAEKFSQGRDRRHCYCRHRQWWWEKLFPFFQANEILCFSNICITANCDVSFNYLDFTNSVIFSQRLAVASLSLIEVFVKFSSLCRPLWVSYWDLGGGCIKNIQLNTLLFPY